MKHTIAERDLEIWADYLVNYSIEGIRSGDLVMIKGEHITWPLMSVLQDKIIKSGGRVDINLVAPDNDRGKVWGAAMARYGTNDQISDVPEWMRARYQAMTKYIEILGAEMPALHTDLPAETSQAIMRADEPLKTIRLHKPWVLTLFPTKAFAELEGMSLEEYTDVIVKASTTDPRLLEKVEEEIYQKMSASEAIRIVTRHPDTGNQLELRMLIGGRHIIKCTGLRNFPDGEVFTSPDANTVEGEIFVDLPVYYTGTTIQGVYLKFKDGRITGYSAKKGEDALRKIIETDEGSHRLGEVALGMNNGIEKVLKHPLFVEKIGGTLHIAIGASYPECYAVDPTSEQGRAECETYFEEGILNRSAQHVDIVTDFRPGGTGVAVYLDETHLSIRDNIWVID
jgi:aminopeptidase